jgi:hypothetical protein
MTASNPAWLPSYGAHTGVPWPEQMLRAWTTRRPPAWQLDAPGRWWWLGVGPHPPVDLMGEVTRGGLDAGGAWPSPVEQKVHHGVVVVCWGTVRGLMGARAAVRQHALGQVPQYVALLGVAVVQLPGRAPRAVRELIQSLRGAAPNVWALAWCDQWTVEPVGQGLTQPPDVAALAADLASVSEMSPDHGPTLIRKEKTR